MLRAMGLRTAAHAELDCDSASAPHTTETDVDRVIAVLPKLVDKLRWLTRVSARA